MKKSIFPFLIMIGLTFVAFGCTSTSSETETNTDTNTETKTTETPNESETSESSAKADEPKNLTIDHGSAGPFVLKAAFPGEGSYLGYNLVRNVVTRGSEEGPYTVITYDCMIGEERHFVLEPNIEEDGSEGSWIQEILVYSDLYKTDAGIGIGSTIEEFYFAYDDAEALYTYISGYYWLSTKKLKSAQFEMNEADYAESPDFDSDMTELDKEKYKKGAKIESIRIY